MKLILITSFSFLLTASLFAQDKVMNLSDFNELSASTSVKIDLVKSNMNKAEINIVKGDIDELKVEESGNDLSIYWKSRSGNWNNKNNRREAKITLYYKDLEAIDVSAGAMVYSDQTVSADDFEAHVNSGGSLELELDVNDLEITVDSGGRFEAEGDAESIELNVNSGGYFGGYKLEAKHIDASADSGGAAKVFASQSIKARANSGGMIKYKGDPKDKNIKKDKWSGGSISEY